MTISPRLKNKLVGKWKLVEKELLDGIEKKIPMLPSFCEFPVVLDGGVIDYAVFDQRKKKFTHLKVCIASTGITPLGRDVALCDTWKTVKIKLDTK
jgi:hypothetical protein